MMRKFYFFIFTDYGKIRCETQGIFSLNVSLQRLFCKESHFMSIFPSAGSAFSLNEVHIDIVFRLREIVFIQSGQGLGVAGCSVAFL